MKKIIVVFLIAVIIYNVSAVNNNSVIIPQQSIRFRIIANSNSHEDQELKLKVKETIKQ